MGSNLKSPHEVFTFSSFIYVLLAHQTTGRYGHWPTKKACLQSCTSALDSAQEVPGVCLGLGSKDTKDTPLVWGVYLRKKPGLGKNSPKNSHLNPQQVFMVGCLFSNPGKADRDSNTNKSQTRPEAKARPPLEYDCFRYYPFALALY
ncbi:hypothetical protein THAOC_09146 [Thalassiosira oceanica]|uniref:Uncharacterized protein n=1 Tax=Thalassiosira oceanica TaxID=159749 RepID=K0ST61_THAOC|nr:hypothetical protein THAOC_09146 [Thalassiosira oceanica]|eukprot:EJK69578.1 hypothetical protein THAOC_09146 [Thalassiosira oceanica]